MKKETLFQLFKYSVYFLIFINCIYFFWEDYNAAGFTFRDGLTLEVIGDAFATAIDSLAWLTLLILFELETYVIPDHKLKGKLKWSFSALAAICYVFLLVAFSGYFDRMMMTYGFHAVVGDACSYVGQVLSYATDIDEYAELTLASCSSIPAGQLYVNPDVSIITSHEALISMHRLSMTDVVNSAAWLLVVVVLQVDVFLQLKGELTQRLYKINVVIKGITYITLAVACFYWAYLGALIDFWDALLWLVAFIFIELNLFKWHEHDLEIEEAEEEAARALVDEAARDAETEEAKS